MPADRKTQTTGPQDGLWVCRANTISVTELALAMHTDEDTLLQHLAGILHRREDTAETDRSPIASTHWNGGLQSLRRSGRRIRKRNGRSPL